MPLFSTSSVSRALAFSLYPGIMCKMWAHDTHAHTHMKSTAYHLLYPAMVSCMLSRSTHPHWESPFTLWGFPIPSSGSPSPSPLWGLPISIIRSLLSIVVSPCPRISPASTPDHTTESWPHTAHSGLVTTQLLQVKKLRHSEVRNFLTQHTDLSL